MLNRPVCVCPNLWAGLSCTKTVPCCFSELYEVREHDRKATREAEKAQEELAAAMQEAEANAK